MFNNILPTKLVSGAPGLKVAKKLPKGATTEFCLTFGVSITTIDTDGYDLNLKTKKDIDNVHLCGPDTCELP